MTLPDTFGGGLLRRTLAGVDESLSPVTYATVISSQTAQLAAWPEWADPAVVAAFRERGVTRPWSHQMEAADHAHAGDHVVVATGTASGKSVAYQLPVLTDLVADPRATALYISPTKALGADQIRSVSALIAGRPEFAHIAPCSYDGDTEPDVRQWAREHSRWLFTNPDMLHLGFLGSPGRWRHFFRHLRTW